MFVAMDPHTPSHRRAIQQQTVVSRGVVALWASACCLVAVCVFLATNGAFPLFPAQLAGWRAVSWWRALGLSRPVLIFPPNPL